MITDAKNKITGGEWFEEFHFSGSGEYEPQTIRARTREEAEQEWQRTRVPIYKIRVEEENINEE